MKLRFRASLMPMIASAVLLGACGSSSSSTTVASATFVSKCAGATNSSAFGGDSQKVNAFCTCVQQKVVAAGFGNRSVNDNSTDLRDAGRQAFPQCAQQAAGGSSGSSGGTSTSP
jgi:hypothetical protein